MIPEAAAFDKKQLKQTETVEKMVLPDKKGVCALDFFKGKMSA